MLPLFFVIKYYQYNKLLRVDATCLVGWPFRKSGISMVPKWPAIGAALSSVRECRLPPHPAAIAMWLLFWERRAQHRPGMWYLAGSICCKLLINEYLNKGLPTPPHSLLGAPSPDLKRSLHLKNTAETVLSAVLLFVNRL